LGLLAGLYRDTQSTKHKIKI